MWRNKGADLLRSYCAAEFRAYVNGEVFVIFFFFFFFFFWGGGEVRVDVNGEVFVKIQKENLWGVGSGGGRGVRVDVNEELKFL